MLRFGFINYTANTTQLLSIHVFDQPICGSVGALLSSDLFRLTGPGLTMQLCCWNRLTHQVTGGVGAPCSLFPSLLSFLWQSPWTLPPHTSKHSKYNGPTFSYSVVSNYNFIIFCFCQQTLTFCVGWEIHFLDLEFRMGLRALYLDTVGGGFIYNHT